MEPATLGAIAGFLSALVVLGVPLLGFLLRLDRRVGRALDLLVGKENVDGDGVLSRLRQVERTLAGVEAALVDADGIEYNQNGAAEPTE